MKTKATIELPAAAAAKIAAAPEEFIAAMQEQGVPIESVGEPRPVHTAADAAAAKTPGYRVGAFLSMDAVSCKLIGYGEYLGDEVHPKLGFPNPHIKLDDGKEVWGCECWWSREEDVRAQIADMEAKGMKVVPIDIDAARKEWESSIA